MKDNTLHTLEQLYGCGLCGKTFRCKLDLNQHTKLQTGDDIYALYVGRSSQHVRI